MNDIEKLKGVNWSKLVTNNHNWISKHLNCHPVQRDKKITARFYSIPYAGLQQEVLTIAAKVADSIEHYVFDAASLKEMRDEDIIPFRKAAEFFGDTDPVYDGKYGELMLYGLSEAVLTTPMVMHKITTLTNVKDQVKGGDGVFFGSYNGQLSILIGESKIHSDFTGALESAFDSINRFNEAYSGSALSHEMFIARSNISSNFDMDTLDLLYKALTPGNEVYNECIKTHPVLMVFQDEYIHKIEVEATSKAEAESLFNNWMDDKMEEVCKTIRDKFDKYPNMSGYHLDFFLIPMKDVSHFKRVLYKSIHGIEFKAAAIKKTQQRKKSTTKTKRI